MFNIWDRPWHRPKAAGYAFTRLRNFVRPPVTVREVPTDLVVDRNIAVTMRDNIVLRVNVYRPPGEGPFPVLLSAHPYGKDNTPKRTCWGWSLNFQFRIINQPQPFEISNETGWEAPDPAWWVKHGYVVINADLRGAGTSDGVGTLLSAREAEDIYDLIEWAGTQPWSTGSVGMLGVSYLAISQYKAAALQPPSLKAICPWEGFTDAYRDFMTSGGIVENGFASMWTFLTARTTRLTENFGKQRKRHPTRDTWWQELSPNLSKIRVPILVCTSFSDANLHSSGSFRLFQHAGSTDKFAYTHRGPKWAIFYSDEARKTQLQFFNRYLRGHNIPKPPPVRLEVRESRTVVADVRDENEWPLARTEWQDLYLCKNRFNDNKLREDGDEGENRGGDDLGHVGHCRGGDLQVTPGGVGRVTFGLRRNAVSFTFPVRADLEVTGPMSVRLWVGVENIDDAHLFVGVEKWTGTEYVPFEGSYGYGRSRVAIGRQRISFRQLDTQASTPYQPVHTFRSVEKVQRGERVPVDIALSPSATFFRAGDYLRLVVAGRYLEPWNPLTGQFPARYVPSRRGRCTIYWGPETPSVLRIPVIP